MSNEQQKLPTLRTVQDLLQKNADQLKAALPRHLTPERLTRVVLTAMTTQPLLQKCDVASILKAVMECAQLGLEPDGILGYAYMIPYHNKKRGCYEAKMIPGYRGYLALARRSGQLRSLDVDVICEHDKFTYQKGTMPTLVHVPPLDKPRGKAIGAYACARLADGGVQFEVLPMERIEKIRQSSRAGDEGPWHTHWDAMAIKTAIRQLAKYLPLSCEFQQLAVREEYLEAGIDAGDLNLGGEISGLMADATAAKAEALKEKYRPGQQKRDEITDAAVYSAGPPGEVNPFDQAMRQGEPPEPGSAG